MGSKFVKGLEINWTLSSIQVIAHSDYGNWVMEQYEYGPDYLLSEKTGSMHFTWKPFDVVEGVVDSLDIDGLPDIPDDYPRCAVCDEPSADRLCSADCVRQELEN
jgi:hypothetical protein